MHGTESEALKQARERAVPNTGTVFLKIECDTAVLEKPGRVVAKPGTVYQVVKIGPILNFAEGWFQTIQVKEVDPRPATDPHSLRGDVVDTKSLSQATVALKDVFERQNKQLDELDALVKAYAGSQDATRAHPVPQQLKPKPQPQAQPKPRPASPSNKPQTQIVKGPKTQVRKPAKKTKIAGARGGPYEAAGARYQAERSWEAPERPEEEAIPERSYTPHEVTSQRQKVAKEKVDEGLRWAEEGDVSESPTRVNPHKVSQSPFEPEGMATGEIDSDEYFDENLRHGRSVRAPGDNGSSDVAPGEASEEAVIERDPNADWMGRGEATIDTPQEQASVEEGEWDTPDDGQERAQLEEADWDTPGSDSSPQLAAGETATLDNVNRLIQTPPQTEHEAREYQRQFNQAWDFELEKYLSSGNTEADDASSYDFAARPEKKKESLDWVDNLVGYFTNPKGQKAVPTPGYINRLATTLVNPEVAKPEYISHLNQQVGRSWNIGGDIVVGIASFIDGLFEGMDSYYGAGKGGGLGLASAVGNLLGASESPLMQALSDEIKAIHSEDENARTHEELGKEALRDLVKQRQRGEITRKDQRELIKVYKEALEEGQEIGIRGRDELKAYAEQAMQEVADTLTGVEAEVEGRHIPTAEPALRWLDEAEEVPVGQQVTPGRSRAPEPIRSDPRKTQILKRKQRLPLPEGENRRIVMESAKRAIADSPHLDPTQKPDFEKLLERNISSLNDKAIEILNQGGGFQFYSDPKKVREEVAKINPKFAQWAKDNPKKRVGGAYLPKDGSIHSDGGLPNQPGLKKANEVMAHEMWHKIGSGIKGTKEWLDAWTTEIDQKGNPLSKYARENPSEGIAEFGRLLVQAQQQGTLDQVEQQFPQASKVVKDAGLWPETSSDPSMELPSEDSQASPQLAEEDDDFDEADIPEDVAGQLADVVISDPGIGSRQLSTAIAAAERERDAANGANDPDRAEMWADTLEKLYGLQEALGEPDTDEEPEEGSYNADAVADMLLNDPRIADKQIRVAIQHAEQEKIAADGRGDRENQERWTNILESLLGFQESMNRHADPDAYQDDDDPDLAASDASDDDILQSIFDDQGDEVGTVDSFPKDENGNILWNTAQRMLSPDGWKEVESVYQQAINQKKTPEEARDIAEGTFVEQARLGKRKPTQTQPAPERDAQEEPGQAAEPRTADQRTSRRVPQEGLEPPYDLLRSYERTQDPKLGGPSGRPPKIASRRRTSPRTK